jgi:predicted transcriptional regulator
MIKTTIYIPDELHRRVKRAAKQRGTSEAELIATAIRHELSGVLDEQQESVRRRTRLLAAIGSLDSSVYPAGHLDGLRAEWPN